MDELHPNNPDHNPISSELLLERSVAKESEPCSTEMEQSSIEETHAKQFEIQTNPVYCSEEGIPNEEKKWNDISACKHVKGNTLQAEISKLGMRLKCSVKDKFCHARVGSNGQRMMGDAHPQVTGTGIDDADDQEFFPGSIES